ncbi:hypothetical protein N7481_007381 [Penicillium waksmanii]|uniref:uncharacterized protein n=1 Tax=Penicillium waksmanii TaxID=69791 RepID=UPI0025469623|nr:uncharacterized protein N7481_007381 [Penicillium waksmanii]KAJ5980083.1 hypothetical protein N7481_007381 [Penicillium waksmanii]
MPTACRQHDPKPLVRIVKANTRANSAGTEAPQQQQQHEQLPVTASFVSPVIAATNTGVPTSSSDQPPSLPATTTSPFISPTSTGQTQLLQEVQSLRRLAADLERRVALSTSTATHQIEHHPSPSPRAHIEVGQSGSPSSSESPRLDQVKDVVAHLERVSMVQSSREPIYVDDLVFKFEHIRNIPSAPTFTVQNVHHPSLPATIDSLYRKIENQEPIELGHLVLLLGIIANTIEVWSWHDEVEGEDSIFPSAVEANAQTPLWVKSAMDVIKSGENGPPLALETIQGIIILAFAVCNTEGVSLRYRSLISTGLLLSRELGLHRIDHESNAASANTIRAEMGRRVWWYLVATDWLLAVLYGGPNEGVYQTHPKHMIVKKPRNINDADLVDNGCQTEFPLSHPTEMSYFLQRIRMAEIARRTVDQSQTAADSSGPGDSTHIMKLDFQLDQFIHDTPFFLNLDTYEDNPEPTSAEIFVHAYLLNLVIHTQRCKLHLRYLTSGPSKSPMYATSREICLKSARQLIRAESQLERAQHPFVLIRLRLSAIRYGVFLACIALLMDAYINGSGSLQDEISHGDVAEALRILEGARCHSWAAQNLSDSLNQVLAKYRAQNPEFQNQSAQDISTPFTPSGASYVRTVPVMESVTTQLAPGSGQLPIMSTGMGGGGMMPPISDEQLPGSVGQSQFDSQMAHNLEEFIFSDVLQWDYSFPSVQSASFF